LRSSRRISAITSISSGCRGPLTPEKRASFADPERASQQREFAFTNATLQGAYLMLAARAVGLDVAPIGGFDRPGIDAAFFTDGRFAAI